MSRPASTYDQSGSVHSRDAGHPSGIKGRASSARRWMSRQTHLSQIIGCEHRNFICGRVTNKSTDLVGCGESVRLVITQFPDLFSGQHRASSALITSSKPVNFTATKQAQRPLCRAVDTEASNSKYLRVQNEKTCENTGPDEKQLLHVNTRHVQ